MIFSQESDFKISPPKFNQGAVTEAKALEISLKNVSVANIDNNILKSIQYLMFIIQTKGL